MPLKILMTFLSLAVPALLTACNTVPHISPVGPLRVDSQYGKLIEDGVRDGLKDPYSAVFGPVRAMGLSDGSVAVCGFVNAKNGFGGYNGMAPYFGIISGQSRKFYLAAVGSDSNAASLCRQAGM